MSATEESTLNDELIDSWVEDMISWDLPTRKKNFLTSLEQSGTLFFDGDTNLHPSDLNNFITDSITCYLRKTEQKAKEENKGEYAHARSHTLAMKNPTAQHEFNEYVKKKLIAHDSLNSIPKTFKWDFLFNLPNYLSGIPLLTDDEIPTLPTSSIQKIPDSNLFNNETKSIENNDSNEDSEDEFDIDNDSTMDMVAPPPKVRKENIETNYSEICEEWAQCIDNLTNEERQNEIFRCLESEDLITVETNDDIILNETQLFGVLKISIIAQQKQYEEKSDQSQWHSRTRSRTVTYVLDNLSAKTKLISEIESKILDHKCFENIPENNRKLPEFNWYFLNNIQKYILNKQLLNDLEVESFNKSLLKYKKQKSQHTDDDTMVMTDNMDEIQNENNNGHLSRSSEFDSSFVSDKVLGSTNDDNILQRVREIVFELNVQKTSIQKLLNISTKIEKQNFAIKKTVNEKFENISKELTKQNEFLTNLSNDDEVLDGNRRRSIASRNSIEFDEDLENEFEKYKEKAETKEKKYEEEIKMLRNKLDLFEKRLDKKEESYQAYLVKLNNNFDMLSKKLDNVSSESKTDANIINLLHNISSKLDKNVNVISTPVTPEQSKLPPVSNTLPTRKRMISFDKGDTEFPEIEANNHFSLNEIKKTLTEKLDEIKDSFAEKEENILEYMKTIKDKIGELSDEKPDKDFFEFRTNIETQIQQYVKTSDGNAENILRELKNRKNNVNSNELFSKQLKSIEENIKYLSDKMDHESNGGNESKLAEKMFEENINSLQKYTMTLTTELSSSAMLSRLNDEYKRLKQNFDIINDENTKYKKENNELILKVQKLNESLIFVKESKRKTVMNLNEEMNDLRNQIYKINHKNGFFSV